MKTAFQLATNDIQTLSSLIGLPPVMERVIAGARKQRNGGIGEGEREREKEREREGEILYIKNYADHFGLPQPSAPHGHNKPAPIYLPCHTTKLLLHSDYIQAGGEVSYTTFRRIWKVACPDIV